MPDSRPTGYATPRQLFAWASFDWAATPFFVVVITFIFASYFTQAVAADPVRGTAQWGWAMTCAAIVIGVASPVFGAIADAGGRRKPWLFTFVLLAAAGMAALWEIQPHAEHVLYALILVVVADVASEVAQTFYNAMLPELSPPEQVGRWSGTGWGLGYIAGIVALLILLFGFVQRDPPLFGLDTATAEHIRIAGPICAVWLLVFSLPLFFVVPDKKSAGLPPVAAAKQGLRALAKTFRDVRSHANLFKFLLARMIYQDGLNTLFAFGGVYAAGTFGMDTAEVIMFGITLNLTAGLGAFAFSAIDDRIGSKKTILIALVGLLVCGTIALLATDKTVFWIVGGLLGIFVGPAGSASRTMMARLAPPEQRAEMFGLFALTGKVTAFIGPFLFGTATWLFDTQRAGMAMILVLFIVGGLLLTRVAEPQRT
ncbi:MAG: MFS transporter [Geminicoccaceae bacterium]